MRSCERCSHARKAQLSCWRSSKYSKFGHQKHQRRIASAQRVLLIFENNDHADSIFIMKFQQKFPLNDESADQWKEISTKVLSAMVIFMCNCFKVQISSAARSLACATKQLEMPMLERNSLSHSAPEKPRQRRSIAITWKGRVEGKTGSLAASKCCEQLRFFQFYHWSIQSTKRCLQKSLTAHALDQQPVEIACQRFTLIHLSGARSLSFGLQQKNHVNSRLYFLCLALCESSVIRESNTAQIRLRKLKRGVCST